MRALRSPRGQSTVEVVALLPLLLVVGIALVSLLSAGRAQEVAGSAAEAGAVALLQHREPRAAVRAALGGWPAQRAQVRVADGRVTVRLTPAGPLGARLRASATARRGGGPVSALLEPLAPEAARDPLRVAPRAVVFGRAGEAVPVAAALAGGLREQQRAAGALLVTWPSAAPPRAALGTPAASRLAARLQARGLGAVARGRLAWLALRADEFGFAARATAAVGVPAVIAVTGPRTAATDALLAEQDLVVLVLGGDAQPGLAALALAGLAGCPGHVVLQPPLDSPCARPAAMAGWGRLRLEVPAR